MGRQLSIKEVASELGLSEKTIRRYLKLGRLKGSFINTSKGQEYRIPEDELGQLGRQCLPNSEKTGQNWVDRKQRSFEYTELLIRHEQAMIRIAQLENQRLMLTEKAESLQEKEKEYQTQIQKLKKQLEEKQKVIENLARKKWWEFWKKPISQLLSEPSQL